MNILIDSKSEKRSAYPSQKDLSAAETQMDIGSLIDCPDARAKSNHSLEKFLVIPLYFSMFASDFCSSALSHKRCADTALNL